MRFGTHPAIDVALVRTNFQGLLKLSRGGGVIAALQHTTEDLMCRDALGIACQGVLPEGLVVVPKVRLPPGTSRQGG